MLEYRCDVKGIEHFVRCYWKIIHYRLGTVTLNHIQSAFLFFFLDRFA